MEKGKVVSLEDRVPTIKEHRKRKANRRLIFLLSLFFLLIVCVIYFQSPFSHIKEFNVLGNNALGEEEAIKQSGLKTGENIWSLDRKQAVKNLESHPRIKSAQIKLGFPNTIQLHIQEFRTIAYVATGVEFHSILENGNILKDTVQDRVPVSAPILSGFKEDKVLEEMANELEKLPGEIVNAISEIHYTPKKTDKYHINLYMNDGFEVSATIPTFAEKMIHYPSYVSQLDPNVKGILDLEVGSFFKAYETGEETVNEDEQEE